MPSREIRPFCYIDGYQIIDSLQGKFSLIKFKPLFIVCEEIVRLMGVGAWSGFPFLPGSVPGFYSPGAPARVFLGPGPPLPVLPHLPAPMSPLFLSPLPWLLEVKHFHIILLNLPTPVDGLCISHQPCPSTESGITHRVTGELT